MSNHNYLLAFTVGAGVLLIGYFIYYDHKRRADPHYKRKLRERRQKMNHRFPMALGTMNKMETFETRIDATDASSFELSDQEIVQNYFQNEIKLGEELFRMGKLDEGLAHMANAIMLCAQPVALMEAMKLALPNRIYNNLLTKLPQLQMTESALFSMDLSLD